MSEATDGFEHWAALMDQQAVGLPLTAAEQAFCERFASEHPECARELAVYAELADLDATPDDESRALVDAALKRMEAQDVREAHAHAGLELGALRKRRLPRLALVSALAAVAAMLVMYVHRTPRRADADLRSAQALPSYRAELVYASGDVNVTGQHAMVGRTLLAEGSEIETGQGSACILIDPEINVCLAAQSRLRLSQLATSKRRLELLVGKASTRLASQPEGMSLSIVADGIASTAIGTAFSVERGAATGGEVVTTVLNGKVRVGREGAEQIVTAHERAVVLGARTGLHTVSRAEEAPSWALLGPTVLWHDPVSATLDVHGEPAQAQALLDDQVIGVAPLSSLIPVGAHHLVIRLGTQVLLERELRVSAGETAEIQYAPAAKIVEPASLRPAVEAPAAKLEHADDLNAKRLGKDERLAPLPQDPVVELGPSNPAEWLAQARKQMREGRFAEAASSYRSIMQLFPNSETAHTVLVSLGQLQLTQLKDPEHAVASLEAYLEHGGALSEEARVARIHALAQLHREADERRAIEELLAKHPHSLDVPELRARLAILQGGE